MIYPSESLLELTATTISRFIISENRNLKYIGIVGLSQIVQINAKYALQHQSVVVDALDDPDQTIRTKTISLLYRMTNYQNVHVIVNKLLQYLKDAPAESSTKKDLVIKINELAERFATDKGWFIQTINKLFEIGGDLITQNISNNFIKLISEWEMEADGEKFQEYTLVLYVDILKQGTLMGDNLMNVIAWVLGEYAPSICIKIVLFLMIIF